MSGVGAQASLPSNIISQVGAQASLAGTDGEVVSRQSLVVRGPRTDEVQSP